MHRFLTSSRQILPHLLPLSLRSQLSSSSSVSSIATRAFSSPSANSGSAAPQPVSPVDEYRHDRSQTEKEEERELHLLYDAVLDEVPKYGWTDRAISAAVTNLDWSPAATRMIRRGPVQVVEEFVRRCNVKLAERLTYENVKDAAAAGGSDPVGRSTFAMRERLEMLEPYHHNWANALALQVRPRNSQRALMTSALMVDEIAHYAGYRSTDFSWYTDRAVLAVIYGATELYWLTDKSTKRADTWRFLEQRMRDSHEFKSGISTTYSNLMTVTDAARGTLKTILRSTRTSY